jgi:hypothetical protein
MIELPTERKAPTVLEPKRLVIISHPKIGKTALASALPKSLILDLEGGAGYYENTCIDVKQLCIDKSTPEKKYTMRTALKDISDTIKAKITADKKSPYDFLIIDTTTVLEEIARGYATVLYKQTPLGKNFLGTDVVSDLSNGAGYDWLRRAFLEIYKWFDGTYNKSLILLGHIKTASITKEGKDIAARDIQLTGKLKGIVTSDADAIGFMFRNKESNQNILSFKSSETDLATGSRQPYLTGREIIISELKDGKLETHWEEIYPSLKNEKI